MGIGGCSQVRSHWTGHPDGLFTWLEVNLGCVQGAELGMSL